jgi:Uma2 family endonuclease
MNAIGTLDRAADTIAFSPPLDDEPLYEIVDGQKVEIPRMGALASFFASDLLGLLNQYGKEKDLGRAVMETLFRLSVRAERNRRPDVAFVSYERWPKDKVEGLDQNAWEVTPDVAIEVISKHDEVEALLTKIEEYFAAKVRLVWVVFPKKSLIYVYESYTKVRILTRQDILEGGAVLPGFRLPVSDFFPETLAQLPRPAENDE